MKDKGTLILTIKFFTYVLIDHTAKPPVCKISDILVQDSPLHVQAPRQVCQYVLSATVISKASFLHSSKRVVPLVQYEVCHDRCYSNGTLAVLFHVFGEC